MQGGLGQQVRYRRVSTEEHLTTSIGSTELLKKHRAETFERISIKVQALAWVIVASSIVYYTNFFDVVLNDSRVHRTSFNLAMICLGINTCIGIYLTLYLPYVKKIEIEWSIYCPRMIPTATIVGLICGFMLVNSLWPVWGFLSPLIIFAIFTGFVFSLHFIPWPF